MWVLASKTRSGRPTLDGRYPIAMFRCVTEQLAPTAPTVTADPGSSPAVRPVPMDEFRRGDTIGRYLILDTLGAGGMGVVYEAFDPMLVRNVAVKLLLPERGRGTTGRSRLLREARAMAKLNHRNVVTVHDVGEIDEHVYVAMERVDGPTLRRWLADTPRDTKAVVAVFVAAGRGLAAAHAVEIVHRDFKPDNVMIDLEHGVAGTPRAVVLDFGIAASVGRMDIDLEDSAPGVVPQTDGDNVRLTRTGALIGTPKYMAPEQLAGVGADARSDQFSFCVALWEALYGCVPYQATSVVELMHSVASGEPSVPPNAPRIPRWLRRTVARGLSADPADRWESMEALLDSLEHTPKRHRALWLGGVGVAGAGAMAATQLEPSRCQDASEQLGTAWDDAQRSKVHGAITAVDVPYAPQTAANVESALDNYAERWAAEHTASCRATHERGVQSAQVLDLRMACLHSARLGLQAATSTLAAADASTLSRAQHVVASLPALSRCSDVERLQVGVAPPSPADADAVEVVRSALSHARTSIAAHDATAAEAAIERAEAAVQSVAYEPAHADTLIERARVEQMQGRYAEADAAFQGARQLAAQTGQWDAVRRATIGRVEVLGYHLHQAEPAAALFDIARGLSANDSRHAAAASTEIGGAYAVNGDYAEAEVEFRSALRLTRESFGPEHPRTLSATTSVVSVLGISGRYAEALEMVRAQLPAAKAVFGPAHPKVATILNNLATAASASGHHDEAEAAARESVAILERLLPAGHPELETTRATLAMTLHTADKWAQALPVYRQTLAALTESLGAEHPHVIILRSNMATALSGLGQFDEAETEARGAIDLWLKAHPLDHPSSQDLHQALATVLTDAGKHEEAVLVWRKAWEITPTDMAAERGNTAFELADALWGLNDRSGARQWAERARKEYAEAGIDSREDRVEVENWLTEHG